jgi:hypothetical protein
MATPALAISKSWKEAVSSARLTTKYFLTTVDPWAKAWQQRDNELLIIRKYGSDWDGLGTEAPNPAHIDVARDFLAVLKKRSPNSPPVRASLTPDGSVTLEWQSKGHYVEAEIIGFDRVEWMDAREGEKAKLWIENLADDQAGEARSPVWEPKIEVGTAVSVSGR